MAEGNGEGIYRTCARCGRLEHVDEPVCRSCGYRDEPPAGSAAERGDWARVLVSRGEAERLLAGAMRGHLEGAHATAEVLRAIGPATGADGFGELTLDDLQRIHARAHEDEAGQS